MPAGTGDTLNGNGDTVTGTGAGEGGRGVGVGFVSEVTVQISCPDVDRLVVSCWVADGSLTK